MSSNWEPFRTLPPWKSSIHRLEETEGGSAGWFSWKTTFPAGPHMLLCSTIANSDRYRNTSKLGMSLEFSLKERSKGFRGSRLRVKRLFESGADPLSMVAHRLESPYRQTCRC